MKNKRFLGFVLVLIFALTLSVSAVTVFATGDKQPPEPDVTYQKEFFTNTNTYSGNAKYCFKVDNGKVGGLG